MSCNDIQPNILKHNIRAGSFCFAHAVIGFLVSRKKTDEGLPYQAGERLSYSERSASCEAEMNMTKLQIINEREQHKWETRSYSRHVC